MPDNENRSLIALPGSALVKKTPGADRVLSAMVGEALVILRTQQTSLQAPRFRIGDHELCEPDHQQVLRWAEELKMQPADFLALLFDERTLPSGNEYARFPNWGGTKIEDGHFVSIHWDLGLLPISHFKLNRAMRITALSFCSQAGEESFTALDLSQMPGLTKLCCARTKITELDLTTVRGLTELDCSETGIIELNLSAVPKLTTLRCDKTGITELDLSSVPGLTALICSEGITELDLSAVPNLTEMFCAFTEIKELDLSGVPRLTKLTCSYTEITELLSGTGTGSFSRAAFGWKES